MTSTILEADSTEDVSCRDGLAHVGDQLLARHFNGLVLSLLSLVGFAVPTVLYLWFVGHYGVNLIQGDMWDQVRLYGAAHAGHLTFSMLWAEYALQRVFFPNLVFLLLDRTVHFNVVFVLYTSAAMLIAAVALVIASHKRRSGLRWLWYCPVAILMMSVVQYEATLDGFALSWYMVALALAVTLVLLDKPRYSWPWVVLAGAVATVGSFSSFQGLLIWPAGLVLLYYRRRPWPVLASWSVVGVIEALIYFHGWTGPEGESSRYFLSFAVHHPAALIDFFFYAIGDILGVQGSTRGTVYLYGIVIVLCAVWALVRVGRRRDHVGSSPIGAALIVFGLLWAVSLSLSQSTVGIYVSEGTRYTVYDMWILGGAYLVFLDPPPRRVLTARKSQILLRASTIVILAAMCVQWIVGTENGLNAGRVHNRRLDYLADITSNFRQTAYPQLSGAAWIYAPAVKAYAPVAQQFRLGQYSTDLAALYERVGITGGRWTGSTQQHAFPWRGVQAGQVVTLSGGGFSVWSRHLAVTECSQNIVTGLYPTVALACDPSQDVPVRVSTFGTIRVPAHIVTGKVGDGSCDAGQVCYLGVVNASSDKLLAYTEVLISGRL